MRRRRRTEEEGMPIGTHNRVITGCGLHHVAVQARDWEASLRLYRDVLGMPVVAEFGSPARRVVLLDMGDGSHVELFQPRDTTPAPGAPSPNDPLTHLALATTDTHGAIDHVRAAGYPGTTTIAAVWGHLAVRKRVPVWGARRLRERPAGTGLGPSLRLAAVTTGRSSSIAVGVRLRSRR